MIKNYKIFNINKSKRYIDNTPFINTKKNILNYKNSHTKYFLFINLKVLILIHVVKEKTY